MAIDIDMTAVRDLEATLESSREIYVLNLLRFRVRAVYPEGMASVGETGREAYFNGYVPAFGSVATDRGVTGVKPVWIGNVAALFAVAAPERWDAIAIVEYPSVAAFLRIVDSDAYRSHAEPMRKAALEEWRLIAQTRMEMPA